MNLKLQINTTNIKRNQRWLHRNATPTYFYYFVHSNYGLWATIFFSKKKEQNENKKKRISTFTSAEAFYAKSAMSTWLATHKTSNENLALLRLTRRLEHNSYRLSPHSLVSCLYVYMTNNGKKELLKKTKK
jgi:hypothetical protein